MQRSQLTGRARPAYAVHTVLVTLLAGVAAALGQTPASQPGQDTPTAVTPLRELSSLNDEQTRTIRNWVEQQVAQVVSKDAGAAGQAIAALRNGISGGKQAYREVYVAACIESGRNAYKSADLQGAARLMAFIASLNEATAAPLLLEALKDQRVAVRTAAAVGLRNCRAKLALAGGSYFSDTIAALREAGKKETSAVTLAAIYQALNFAEGGSPPDARANCAALLEILEGRAEQYAAGNAQGETAEISGVRTAEALVRVMNDEEKKRLAAALGKILKGAVVLYTRDYINVKDQGSSPQMVEARNTCESLIEQSEKVLLDVLKPKIDPKATVTENMKKGDSVKIKTSMNAWADVLEQAVGIKVSVDADR